MTVPITEVTTIVDPLHGIGPDPPLRKIESALEIIASASVLCCICDTKVVFEMGKNSGRKKNNRKKKGKKGRPDSIQETNFVSNAGPGCYIARRATGREDSPDWMIGWEDVDPEDFEDDEGLMAIPDIALDPEDGTVSICNVENYTKVAYVTVFDTTVLGSHRRELQQGSSTDNGGKTVPCVTFIVLCPPCVFAHLCYLDISSQEALTSVRIESDVSRWKEHPNPSDEHPYRIGFPLGCCQKSPSFLCTQGEGGELTHFFSGNLHAIDFRCPVGTELLAVADGTVLESKDHNTLTGIAVTNLFEWNSILLQIQTVDSDNEDQRSNDVGENGALVVEYVHISKSLVQAGDRVTKGQVIGYSGSVGFSPEPHLHFSAFRSSDAEAPTTRVYFESENGNTNNGGGNNQGSSTFLPRAGEWYNDSGIVHNLTI